MVALDTPSLPSSEALIDSLLAVPGLAVDPLSLQTTDNAMVLALGKDRAALALATDPIPWSNLEGPCATAWWWPAATERMQGHTSHILIALAGDTGPLILRYLVLTHLTAAVSAHTEAVGIYWLAGSLVHDPQVFLDQVQSIMPGCLPLHLWIDFRIESTGDGRHRMFTTGMRAFRQDEIEIPPSERTPAEILDFSHAIAEYLLRTNPEIGKETTMGRSEAEKIAASYQPSMLDPTVTVLRLDF